MATTHESPNVFRGELTQGPAEVDATGGTVTAGPDPAYEAKSSLAAPVQEEPADTDAMSATETLRQEIDKARKLVSSSNPLSPAEEVLYELETLKGLLRELSAIGPIVANSIANDPIVTNRETIQKKGQAAEPTSEPAVDDIGLQNMAALEEPAIVPATEAPPDAPAFYTGRGYLMFDANLKQEVLETVWDAIEESSEVGAIVDTRLVSGEEGVQMTLDLRSSQLDISAVRARLPGAEFAPMGEDRLRISWPVPV